MIVPKKCFPNIHKILFPKPYSFKVNLLKVDIYLFLEPTYITTIIDLLVHTLQYR